MSTYVFHNFLVSDASRGSRCYSYGAGAKDQVVKVETIREKSDVVKATVFDNTQNKDVTVNVSDRKLSVIVSTDK